MIKLMGVDSTGALDQREAMNVATQLTIPQYAQRVLRTAEESQEDITRKVSQDLALIASGQNVPAQPNGGQVALDYINNEYLATEGNSERILADANWTQRLDDYMKQYQFIIEQNTVNPIRGRTGRDPLALNGVTNAQ
jgi:hypothetical protein